MRARWFTAAAVLTFGLEIGVNIAGALVPEVVGVVADLKRGYGGVGPVRPIEPYLYGIIVCMKKTLHIDEELLREARSASGAKTDTDTVRLGLEALVRHAAYERLRALRGSEPRARNVRRRRERASKPSRRSAA